MNQTILYILLFMILIGLLSCKSSINSTSSNKIKFVIPENCDRIAEKSHRCCGKITVYRDGQVSSKIRTSSNRFEGFTGAILITLLDQDNLVIYELYTSLYGVNGNSSRLDNWNTKIPEWVINNAKYGTAYGIRPSYGRLEPNITEIGKKYLLEWTIKNE